MRKMEGWEEQQLRRMCEEESDEHWNLGMMVLLLELSPRGGTTVKSTLYATVNTQIFSDISSINYNKDLKTLVNFKCVVYIDQPLC